MKNLSIRTQLMLLALTVVAVVVVLGVLQFVSGSTITRARAETNVIQVAQVASSHVHQLLSDARTAMERHAAVHSVRTGESRAECHERLRTTQRATPQFDAIFEVGPDGDVLCSSLELGDQRFNVADTSWFRTLKGGAEIVVERPRIGPVSGRWVTAVLAAVRDEDGTFLGVSGASVDLGRFQQMLSEIPLPSGVVITMVDQDGFIMARSADPERWLGKRLDLTSLLPASDPYAGPGTAVIDSRDGVERVWGWSTIEGSSWLVFAGLPTSWVDGPVRDAVLRGAAVALILLLATGMLALTLYRQIVGALDELLDRVRRAMRDEAGPIEIEGPHELREMAVGLNRIVVERRQLEFEVRHRQKMEAVGRLAGEIAHDFNNVLTVISSGADLAALDLTEEHPALEPVEEIRAAAARATALTGQLLSFSRKKSEELVERVDVNALISGLEGMLGRVIGREVQLRTDLSAEAPLIMGDSDQLEQSLMNLAVNAGDAMPDGGTFTIRTERIPSAEVPTVIDLDRNGDAPDEGGVRDKDWLHIVVSDTGHGISPEIEERIFEPFFTTKAAGHGTGLGLATVYAAVRRFGGRIDVRSRVGDGTDFHIYFPAAGEGDEPG